MEKWNELIGKKIDEKYIVLSQLNYRGQVAVFLISDIQTNKSFQMKVCDSQKQGYDSKIREFLVGEAQIMMKLEHPAVPKIEKIIEDNRYTYIIMEYIEGKSMQDIVSEEGELALDKVLDWGKQVCSFLLYLHNLKPTIVHGALNSCNIIISPGLEQIKVAEFRTILDYISNVDMSNELYTEVFNMRGYVPPEQFMGQIDVRTDIYRLGVIMYYLVTGVDPCEPPYVILPVCKINPALPRSLEYIIEKCIKIDPVERYQNCEELLRDLEMRYIPVKKPEWLKCIKDSIRYYINEKDE